MAIVVLHLKFTSLACHYDQNSINRTIIVSMLSNHARPFPFRSSLSDYSKASLSWRLRQPCRSAGEEGAGEVWPFAAPCEWWAPCFSRPFVVLGLPGPSVLCLSDGVEWQ